MDISQFIAELGGLTIKANNATDPLVKESGQLLQMLCGALLAEEPYRQAFFDQIRSAAKNVRGAMQDLPWNSDGS